MLLNYVVEDRTNLMVHNLHFFLFLALFVDFLLEELKTFLNDFLVQLQLLIFPLYPLLLIANLVGEEIHHIALQKVIEDN